MLLPRATMQNLWMSPSWGCTIAPSIPAFLGFGWVCSCFPAKAPYIPILFWWIYPRSTSAIFWRTCSPIWGFIVRCSYFCNFLRNLRPLVVSNVCRWHAFFGGSTMYSCIFEFAFQVNAPSISTVFWWISWRSPWFSTMFRSDCDSQPFWGMRHLFIFRFCLGLQLLPQECSTPIFPRCFGGFLRDPAFPAVFWGDLQPLVEVTPFIPASFWFWLALHVLHNFSVDFLGIPPFQSAVFWGDLQPIFWGCTIYSSIFRFGLQGEWNICSRSLSVVLL